MKQVYISETRIICVILTIWAPHFGRLVNICGKFHNCLSFWRTILFTELQRFSKITEETNRSHILFTYIKLKRSSARMYKMFVLLCSMFSIFHNLLSNRFNYLYV